MRGSRAVRPSSRRAVPVSPIARVVFVAAAAVLPALAANAERTEAGPVRPYSVPDAVEDSPYTVEVDGVRIPVEQFAHVQEAYCARFQLAGGAHVRITTGEKTPCEFEVKPADRLFRVVAGANSLDFDWTGPGPQVVTATAGERTLPALVLIADEWDDERQPASDRTVLRIQPSPGEADLRTDEIQAALDECARQPGGGTIYFESGVYHTGALRVGSKTTVYLAPGALIVGSTDPGDYPEGPDGRALLLFDRCADSSLRGYGVVDGMGHVLRNERDVRVHLADLIGCRNVRIADVTLRNPASWCVHVLGCTNVRIDGLKVLNDWGVANTDGVNPDHSSDVAITRYFGHCGDDAIAVKTTLRAGMTGPCHNIRVTDSVVMTRKTALKCGTETRADIHDVRFENVDIINSSRGIGLWMRDGATIYDVAFRDIRMDLHEIEGENMSGEPIRAVVEERRGIGTVRDISFERLRIRAPYQAILAGMPESRLRGFAFRDVSWALAPRTIKLGPVPVVDLAHAEDFQLDGIALDRSATQQQLWGSFIRQRDTERIAVADLHDSGAASAPPQ